MSTSGSSLGSAAARRLLIPLALTQFVASFAGSNMNVAINSISQDLDTTVHGVQTAITLFLLCMAALMIPGSKLTDRWGRKRCLVWGLGVYGTGAVIAALAPVLGVLIVGYSLFEGVGSALMIPPIYILATLAFSDVQSRARAFGAISGAGGIGAAAGPLIGGLITTTISWRASFLLQAAIVATIISSAGGSPTRWSQTRHVRSTLPEPSSPPPECSLWSLGSSKPATTTRCWPSSSRWARRSCSGSSSTSVRVSERARSRCCRPRCFVTALRTSAWSPRIFSG
jgi:MFS family permease